MIRNNELNFLSFNESSSPVELSASIRFLIRAIRFLKPGKMAYKLDFYERFLNYLRIIGLASLSQSQSVLDDLNAEDESTNHSFARFLIHLGLVEKQDSKWKVKAEYSSLAKDQLLALLEKSEKPAPTKLSEAERQLVDDFLHIRDLVKKYRQPETPFKHIRKHRKTWEKLVQSNQLDYEIRLSETLFHLWKFRSGNKIRSPFDEAYYTESGRSAFRNFTRPLFQKYISQLTSNLQHPKVFDLGCGYGNYVELVREIFPGSQLTGVEINPEVYHATREKFSTDANVEIINSDFFELNATKQYDFVLMNYVLFYFSQEDQKAVLRKAASLLNPGGSIVLCQYFSGIENLKEQLAERQKEFTLFKKIVMYYSDKILYANTLWNDSVDTFASAVKWDHFRQNLRESGLYIESATNADPYYYSLFVEIKVKL